MVSLMIMMMKSRMKMNLIWMVFILCFRTNSLFKIDEEEDNYVK